MSNQRPAVILGLVLALVGGGLRFARLGAWPFTADELATVREVRAAYGSGSEPINEQDARLTRLVPIAYAMQFLDYGLFGDAELGSRVIPALLGTLQIVLVFWTLDGPLGRPAALATALLLMTWPDHLYQSQQNRFYMAASFFASLCMVLGASGLWLRSTPRVALACLAALAAILCHTLQGLLIAGLLGSLVAGSRVGGRGVHWRMLGIVIGAGVVALGLFAGYLLPMLRGWNLHEGWGYGPAHALMAAINQLGWPVALLAALGALWALVRPREQQAYWLAWGGLWLAASVALPMVVVYHPGYVFPLALGVLVLAGMVAGEIFSRLSVDGVLVSYAWLAVVAGLNFPSVVSYYRDGSRYDYRSAAEYVARSWRQGDRVACDAPRLLGHYAEVCRSAVGVAADSPLRRLNELRQTPGRLWIVLPRPRAGRAEEVRHWLSEHAVEEVEICRRRFDYYDYAVDVFLSTSADRPARK